MRELIFLFLFCNGSEDRNMQDRGEKGVAEINEGKDRHTGRPGEVDKQRQRQIKTETGGGRPR